MTRGCPRFFSHELACFSPRQFPLDFLRFSSAAPAFAQEGGGDITDSPTGSVFRWINFAIVFGSLCIALGKWPRRISGSSPRKFHGRSRKARARAKRPTSNAQAAQGSLRELAPRSRRSAPMQSGAAEAEAQRLRALARAEAEMIAKAAQAEIAAARARGSSGIEILAARLAIERAESLLQQQITAAEAGDAI